MKYYISFLLRTEIFYRERSWMKAKAQNTEVGKMENFLKIAK